MIFLVFDLGVKEEEVVVVLARTRSQRQRLLFEKSYSHQSKIP
jgi:hypothetical protein